MKREKILCDDCKKLVGWIDKDAMVCSCDQFEGIDIYCKKCKTNRIGKYYEDINQLLRKEV